VEFFGDLERSGGGLSDRAAKIRHLPGGLISVKIRLRFGDEGKDFIGDARFCGLELAGREFLSGREKGDVEKILGDGDIEISGGGRAVGEADAEIKNGIFEQAGLNQIGLRDAEIFERRLEMMVIE